MFGIMVFLGVPLFSNIPIHELKNLIATKIFNISSITISKQLPLQTKKNYCTLKYKRCKYKNNVVG